MAQQRFVLEGTVLDGDSKPLFGAVVQLKPGDRLISTDQYGRFQFKPYLKGNTPLRYPTSVSVRSERRFT
jgi:protocatechuate 3,4-dioxygenase beta subunit